jgi:hypothetical protein
LFCCRCKPTSNQFFFGSILFWDDTIWDLTDIDITNGVYPTLIVDEED